jgi:mannitol-1-phosphate 5-dehydrogenase
MKVVVFGPGHIGCGFAGQLLHESGHQLVFVARDPVIVDHFNRLGRYQVRLVGQGQTRDITVDGVRAVSSGDPERVAEEIADAGLVTTSVHCANLPTIAPLISEGLRLRTEPINVIAFENMGTAAECLRKFVSECKFDGYGHGFSPALVSRVMSERIGNPASDEPLIFVGDHAGETIVDGRRLVHPIPTIKGLKVVEDFDPWVQRKLFMFSAGHATTAYLGFLKGYHYIHTAIRDAEIHDAVLAAMREGQEGLRARYGPDVAGDESTLLEIVARFENAALNDSIERVGRESLRKLQEKDRLVGPAKLAEEAGVSPEKLMLGVAAALFYCNERDPTCSIVREEIGAAGPGKLLSEVSGLDPTKPLSRLAVETFSQLMASRGSTMEGSEGPLLSLDRFFWA